MSPIMTIGAEDIYWLLTAKSMAMGLMSGPQEWSTPKCTSAVSKLMQKEHCGISISGEGGVAIRTLHEHRRAEWVAWLVWMEDWFARSLTRTMRAEMLQVVNEKNMRVWYRNKFNFNTGTCARKDFFL